MEEGLVCRLKCSFEVSSVANSCGRAARGMMWVGSDLRFCVGFC